MVAVDGDVLVVLEEKIFFRLCESGRKPNVQVNLCAKGNREMRAVRPTIRRIRVYNEHGLEFERDLTDMTCIGSHRGAYEWVFSWRHDETPTRRGGRRPQTVSLGEGLLDKELGANAPSRS